MKKNIKIFLICFVVGLGIAMGVWYFVNPVEFTKFADIVWENLNRPLPIVGISLLTVGGFIVGFLKTTSIGQKGLKLAKEKYELAIKTKDETIKLLTVAKETAEKAAQEANEKYTALNDKFNKMIDILPNKKLKGLKDEEINEREN